jgi:hypothetical protein
LNDTASELVEAQRVIFSERSEHEKTKALNAQKITFLELQLAQKTQTEAELVAEQQSMMANHQEQIK